MESGCQYVQTPETLKGAAAVCRVADGLLAVQRRRFEEDDDGAACGSVGYRRTGIKTAGTRMTAQLPK